MSRVLFRWPRSTVRVITRTRNELDKRKLPVCGADVNDTRARYTFVHIRHISICILI